MAVTYCEAGQTAYDGHTPTFGTLPVHKSDHAVTKGSTVKQGLFFLRNWVS